MKVIQKQNHKNRRYKMKNVIERKPGQPFEILLLDWNGEYRIPTNFPNIQVKEVWDGYNVSDILDAAIKDTELNHIELIEKAFNKLICDPNMIPRLEFEKEDKDKLAAGYCYVFKVTIRKHTGLEIHDWIDQWLEQLDLIIKDAGGDDDICDYVPSFIDLFRQVCEALSLPHKYNDFVDKLFKEDPSWREFVHVSYIK
jgi:hypothetical protein